MTGWFANRLSIVGRVQAGLPQLIGEPRLPLAATGDEDITPSLTFSKEDYREEAHHNRVGRPDLFLADRSTRVFRYWLRPERDRRHSPGDAAAGVITRVVRQHRYDYRPRFPLGQSGQMIGKQVIAISG